MIRFRRLVALLLVVPAVAAAQLPRVGRRPRQPRPPRPAATDTFAVDSARRDSTSRKQIVQWAEADSVMTALLARQGYTVTRYQGNSATFDAVNRSLYLEGHRAAVGREETVLVGDTVLYNDSTQVIRAKGDTIILHDPARGEDLVALGSMLYNITEGHGIVTNVSTAVQSGERWFVHGDRGAIVNEDTARARAAAFYARDGTVTSCDEKEPHYHFEGRELKVVKNRVLVARPAVLYIADVPVMWLPFLFQDLRSGRRSGILTPRFGISEVLRNSPTYRRHVENIGYYFALNDYMDASLALDWRSGARPSSGDPGWVRERAEYRYRWLNRFISGGISGSYLTEHGLARELALSWFHSQDFSQATHLSTNLNYSSNTFLKNQTAFLPAEVFAAIASQVNFSTAIRDASVSIGGSRKQYSGRSQVDQDFPNFNLSTKPINIGSWFVWTPTVSLSNNQVLNADQVGQLSFRYVAKPGGGVDSVRIKQNSRNTALSINTPLRLFGFDWRNSFRVSDRLNDFPQFRTVYTIVPRAGGGDTTIATGRVFSRTFVTSVDWDTGIDLPSLFQGTWKLTPSVSIVNVDPNPFLVRTERTGSRFVHQSKRLQYSLASTPTFFGLFPGIGGISRFRHSITPQISFAYAPAAEVSDEFLSAINAQRTSYLGSNSQNQVSLSLTQNLEAKFKSASDTATDQSEGRKLKLLSLQFDPITYDFQRLREIRRRSTNPASISRWRGITNSNFGYRVTSELLPGFDFGTSYSLFEGNPISDTAVFKPYRTNIHARFSIDRSSGLVAAFSRLFGRAVPQSAPELERTDVPTEEDEFARQAANQPYAGGLSRSAQFAPPASRNWTASFSFTSTRQRPITRGSFFAQDPTAICTGYLGTPQYDICIAQQSLTPYADSTLQTTYGGIPVRSPPTSALTSDMGFPITQKWSGRWTTTYNFQEHQFASHVVTLQRDLHDWRAIFAFTQAPNGNFAFSFFIALKAEPDLKFDYDKRTYRPVR